MVGSATAPTIPIVKASTRMPLYDRVNGFIEKNHCVAFLSKLYANESLYTESKDEFYSVEIYMACLHTTPIWSQVYSWIWDYWTVYLCQAYLQTLNQIHLRSRLQVTSSMAPTDWPCRKNASTQGRPLQWGRNQDNTVYQRIGELLQD